MFSKKSIVPLQPASWPELAAVRIEERVAKLSKDLENTMSKKFRMLVFAWEFQYFGPIQRHLPQLRFLCACFRIYDAEGLSELD